MNSLLLQVFLRIFECGSITEACTNLGLSQPAVSKSLRRLEDVLEVKLFDRTPSGMTPTIYGKSLARYARMVEADLGEAAREIHQLKSASRGHVHFGVSPVIAASVLPRALPDLLAEKKTLNLLVLEGAPERLSVAVRTGELEFAICTTASLPDTDKLVADALFEDPFGVVAARNHPLAKKRSLTLRQLQDPAWVLSAYSNIVRRWFESRFLAEGVSPPLPRVETSSLAYINALVGSGRYLSFVPLLQVQNELATGEFVVLKPDTFTRQRRAGVMYRRSAGLSPGGRAVLESIRIAAERMLGEATFQPA